MHNLLHHCIHMYEWMLAASGLQITLVQVKKHEKFKICSTFRFRPSEKIFSAVSVALIFGAVYVCLSDVISDSQDFDYSL